MRERVRQKLLRQMTQARKEYVLVQGVDTPYADMARNDYRLIEKLTGQFLPAKLVRRAIERGNNK